MLLCEVKKNPGRASALGRPRALCPLLFSERTLCCRFSPGQQVWNGRTFIFQKKKKNGRIFFGATSEQEMVATGIRPGTDVPAVQCGPDGCLKFIFFVVFNFTTLYCLTNLVTNRRKQVLFENLCFRTILLIKYLPRTRSIFILFVGFIFSLIYFLREKSSTNMYKWKNVVLNANVT